MTTFVKFGDAWINPATIGCVRQTDSGTQVMFMLIKYGTGGVGVSYTLDWNGVTPTEWMNWLQTNERVVIGEIIANPEDLR